MTPSLRKGKERQGSAPARQGKLLGIRERKKAQDEEHEVFFGGGFPGLTIYFAHLKHGFFNTKIQGNHNLQGNVQVYYVRIPVFSLGETFHALGQPLLKLWVVL